MEGDKIPNVEISPDEKHQCVRIKSRLGPWPYDENWLPREFPTRKDLEAYNRIAKHIRSIATTQTS